MSPTEVESYKQALEDAAIASTDREVWLELVFLGLCYLRDHGYALDVATRAARAVPDDPEIENWKTIIEMWGSW